MIAAKERRPAKKTFKRFVYFIGIVAALAGLLFGLDTGVISGALPILTVDYHLTASQQGWIVSSLLCGAVAGTFLSNPLSFLCGRRMAIVVSTLLFTVGAVLSGLAPSIHFLIVVRFFLGVALGIAAYTTPLYLAEIAPEAIRGALISTYQLMITIGLAAAFLSDTFFSRQGQWRWMLGVVAIPSMIMLALVCYLPRSPRWLILKRRYREARVVLHRLLHSHWVEREVKAIQRNLPSGRRTPIDRHLWQRFLVVLALGLGAQMLQQWTGINVLMYYAPTVFKAAGFVSLEAQMWCTVAIGVINVLTTLMAIRLVDRWGRKPILYTGLGVMVVSLSTVALTLHLPHSGLVQAVSVMAVLTYVFGFAFSLGPIVWLICAEIFPLRMRDTGLMFTTAANWLFNFLLAANFPHFISAFGASAVFISFAVVSLIGIAFVRYFVPETRGMKLEVIEENLMAGQRLRDIGVIRSDES